jgi:hypothetical protein
MRHYPYFAMDLITLLVLLIIIPASAFLMSPPSTETAAASVLVFAALFVSGMGKTHDFESSIKNLKNVKSWKSDFMSFGTLIFNYDGDPLKYSSMLRGKENGLISVDYIVQAKNNSDVEIVILNRGNGDEDSFGVSGDGKFIESIKKDVENFNKKYKVKSITNAEGLLEVTVNLRFKQGPPPSKQTKLDDMTSFLDELLAFTVKINSKLKSPEKKPRKKRAKRKK